MKKIFIDGLEAIKQDEKVFNIFEQIKEQEAKIDKIKPVVLEYSQRVLNQMKLTDKRTGKQLTNYENIYLCENENLCNEYFKRIEQEKIKAGFTGLGNGYCPLLITENKLMNLKHEIIKQCLQYMDTITYDQLTYSLKHFNQYYELIYRFINTQYNLKNEVEKMKLFLMEAVK